MARVNVEQQALIDHRFIVLGELLSGDRYLGLGVMVYVWNACQETASYTLTEHELIAITGKTNIASAIVDAGLGTRVKGGGIRIRGTKGRIEWLAKSRKNGTKGGRPKRRLDNQTVPEIEPLGSSENIPPAPAPALTENQKKKTAAQRKPKASQTSIPADLPLSPAMREFALKRLPQIDVQTEFEKFHSWHTSKQTLYSDWSACWRTWILKIDPSEVRLRMPVREAGKPFFVDPKIFFDRDREN